MLLFAFDVYVLYRRVQIKLVLMLAFCGENRPHALLAAFDAMLLTAGEQYIDIKPPLSSS